MKKSLLVLSSLIGMAVTAIAQPSLTAAQCNPVVGDVFVTKNTNSVSPGSAGINQTWNFSSMVASSTTNYTTMTASSTPSASSYPSANLAVSDGTNYVYYQTSSSSWLNYGVAAGTALISYTNAEVMVNYPFNYGSSVVDPWGGTVVSGSFTFARYGTTTITADAYGTLTTPAGTFTNVMRLHVKQVYKDSALSFPYIMNYSNDEYVWYRPGTHYPLATTYAITSGTSTSTGGFYLNNVTTGINESQSISSSFHLFPNPATNNVVLKYASPVEMKGELVVYNALGQKVITQTINISGGLNTESINVSVLPEGTYFLQLQSNSGVLKNEKFIISR